MSLTNEEIRIKQLTIAECAFDDIIKLPSPNAYGDGAQLCDAIKIAKQAHERIIELYNKESEVK